MSWLHPPVLRNAIMRKSYLASAVPHSPCCFGRRGGGLRQGRRLAEKAYPAATATKNGFEISGDYLRRIDPDLVACKAWPARPELTLVAVPLIEPIHRRRARTRAMSRSSSPTRRPAGDRPAPRERYGVFRCGPVRQPLVRYRRYDLKAGLRAFGVRTVQANSSQIDPSPRPPYGSIHSKAGASTGYSTG